MTMQPHFSMHVGFVDGMFLGIRLKVPDIFCFCISFRPKLKSDFDRFMVWFFWTHFLTWNIWTIYNQRRIDLIHHPCNIFHPLFENHFFVFNYVFLKILFWCMDSIPERFVVKNRFNGARTVSCHFDGTLVNSATALLGFHMNPFLWQVFGQFLGQFFDPIFGLGNFGHFLKSVKPGWCF